MENGHRFLRIFFVLTSFLIASNADAQSVTITAIPGAQFCVGDPVSVTFTATGAWKPGNIFTLQISEPSGSFTNGFQNVGSLADSLAGTFTIDTTIPHGVSTSAHYRFRILGTRPYVASADNGNDIEITTPPGSFDFYPNSVAGVVGTPITFSSPIYDHAEADAHDVGHWDFGSGATPATATTTASDDGSGYVQLGSAQTTYSTTGDKTITLRTTKDGGCPSMSGPTTATIHIYDCSIPSIPHDAIVVDSVTAASDAKTYWVNPGATLYFAIGDTIFAEPGSTVSGPKSQGYCVMYMKPGSVLKSIHGDNVVIYGDGASLSTFSSDFIFNCHALDFDYSNAPANPAHPLGVKYDLSAVSLTLSPNPTNGLLSVKGLPSGNITVSVSNILGQTVMEQKNTPTHDLTLDLSKLGSGTYYVRFASANSVVTKMVVRE